MKDLTGERFGRLVAVEPTSERVGTMVVWRCVCDCGNVAYAASSNLTRGRVRSCGCLAHEARSLNLTGRRFGKLVAVERVGVDERGRVLWRCKCDCGQSDIFTSRSLMRGRSSCGRCVDTVVRPGMRFGELVAVDEVTSGIWRCVSDAGEVVSLREDELRSDASNATGLAPTVSRELPGEGAA